MERLSDIVSALDGALASTPLAHFYEDRKKLKGGYNWRGSLLSIQKQADTSRSGYAFHKGGREELQFNVGLEDEGAYFRYGVAFSLEPDRNLQDPVEVLEPKIKRFNQVIAQFPNLASLRLWHHFGEHRSSLPVGPIPDDWIRPGSFVFLGERVRVPASGVGDEVIARAAQVLLMLLPLYRSVEGEGNAAPVDYRVARLCWNTDFWQQPTGREGKSHDPDSYEAEVGFGHEEWLFDLGMLIDGWKYGYVQALHHSHEKYQGQQLGLLLYTIDSRTKRRFWVGAIDRADVLTDAEAQHGANELRKRGWLKAMREQVAALGLDAAPLDVGHPLGLANVRFRPEVLRLFDPPVPFPREALPSAYYGTLQKVPETQAEILRGDDTASKLVERNLETLKTTRRVYEDTKEVDLVQAQWQQQLRKTLSKDLPGVEFRIETEVDGHRLDGVIGVGPDRVFVELKARGTVRQVIRQALSQLMEYAYWPNRQRCGALLIVGAFEAGAQEQEYLSMLRERFGLPVHYLPFRDGHIVGIAEWLGKLTQRTK